jgi:Ca2+-binding RTX toxin-like protein
MAIKIKGKKVTGTKKKDKITWQNKKEWKKALIVNAGKGNDVIDFSKSKYKNTLNGQDGNDIIKGGKKNDKITGGKGNDTIYTGKGTNTVIINKGDGNDTIYHQGIRTNIKVNKALASDKKLFEKKGNDLILSYTHAGTSVTEIITLKNYYTGNKSIFLNNQKLEDLINTNGLKLSGSGNIQGTNGNDNITGSSGNDTIYGNGGNDVINGGAGNDVINAGAGNNTIYFGENNGTNTIINGGGTDTLVFSNETDFSNFKFAYDQNNLNIAASGTTVKLQNYADGGHSAKYLKVGNNTYDISNVILETGSYSAWYNGNTVNGTNGNDFIVAQPETNAIVAGVGDDVIFGSSSTKHYDLGSGGNNVVYVSNSNENPNIFIGMGNDTIYGNSDSEHKTYMHIDNGNCGNNTYYDNGSGLILVCYKEGMYEESYFIGKDNDLIFKYENSTLTIKDYFNFSSERKTKFTLHIYDYNSDTQNVSFVDFIGERGLKTFVEGFNGTDGNDYIIGTNNAETINAYALNDVIDPKGGDDEIHLGSGNDMVLAGSGSKTIYADSGNNIINLGSGNNTVYAGTGSNTINYGNGSDTITFSVDTLSNLNLDLRNGKKVITKTSDNNTVTINSLDSLTEGVTIKDSTNTTSNLFNLNTTVGDENSNSGQELATGDRNDTIYTGFGYDNITAGAGNNTIYLQIAESGNNNTYTYTADAQDYLVIKGLDSLDGLKFLRTENDLKIAYANGDFSKNTITITNYYDATQKTINIAHIGTDSTVYAPSSLSSLMTADKVIENMSCTGTHTIDASDRGNPVNITGCSSADNITGSSYNDIINGKGGADVINGGNGNDLYEIDSGDWGTAHVTITDSSGTNDTLRINTTSDKINLFFDVTQTGVVTNGNVTYTKGNDLYINSDNNYSFANAKTYNGAKISNYFTTGEIENILIPNSNDWVNAFDEKVVNIVSQTVANWLKKNGYNSTTDSMSGEKKAELLRYYKPIGGTPEDSSVDGTSGNDLIIAPIYTGYALYTQTIRPGEGDDIIYGSSNTGNFYLNNGNGNNTVYIDSSARSNANVYLGSGNDTIYGSETENKTHNIMAYENSGNNTVILRASATLNLDVSFPNIDYKDIVFTKEGNDLTYRHKNNSITIKDYYSYNTESWRISYYNNNEYCSGTINDFISGKGGVYTSYIGTDANDTFTTTANGEGYVVTGAGTNTINSNGNDFIYVSGTTNTINLSGEDTEKSIYMTSGSNATVIGVFDIGSDGVTMFNFGTDVNNVMVYREADSEDLQLVTRHFGTVANLKDVMADVTTGSEILNRVRIFDENSEFNVNELWSYYDMTHENTNTFTRTEYYDKQGEGIDTSFFVDGTTSDDWYRNFCLSDGYGGHNIINDFGGDSDILAFGNDTYQNSYQNFGTFFDVYKDENGSWQIGDDLIFINDFKEFREFESGGAVYVKVTDFRGDGKIEIINDYNSNGFNYNKLDTVKAQVANWLTSKNYTSAKGAIDALGETFTDADKVLLNDLQACYNSAWTDNMYGQH